MLSFCTSISIKPSFTGQPSRDPLQKIYISQILDLHAPFSSSAQSDHGSQRIRECFLKDRIHFILVAGSGLSKYRQLGPFLSYLHCMTCNSTV